MTEIFIAEKEKSTNKKTDKQYVAVFFVTQYNLSLSSFVLNFRIRTQVVAEKSLTEKKNPIGEIENEQIKGLISNM